MFHLPGKTRGQFMGGGKQNPQKSGKIYEKSSILAKAYTESDYLIYNFKPESPAYAGL